MLHPKQTLIALTIVLCAAALSSNVLAATVNGSYTGIIVRDDGLGLIGQTMRFDFTYDDTIAGVPVGAGSQFSGFYNSMTVTIGINVWQWDSTNGSSFAILNNVDTLVADFGIEDRVILSSTRFSGPTLVLDTVEEDSYGATIFLSDVEPEDAPDGLNSDMVLPGAAPNVSLFSAPGDPNVHSGPGLNLLRFGFSTINPEFGDTFYDIDATVVPLPPALILFGTAIAGVFGIRRQRKWSGIIGLDNYANQ